MKNMMKLYSIFLGGVAALSALLLASGCAATEPPAIRSEGPHTALSASAPAPTAGETTQPQTRQTTEAPRTDAPSTPQTTRSTEAPTTLATTAPTTTAPTTGVPATSAPTKPATTPPQSAVQPETPATQPGTQPAAHQPTAVEQEVLDLMNQYRAAEGLPPLTYASHLYPAVKLRAQEIQQTWSHTRPDGRRYNTALTDCGLSLTGWHGENCAKGYKDAKTMVEALMASDGHRKNILFPSYDCVGICVLDGPNGSYYMVQIFEGKS